MCRVTLSYYRGQLEIHLADGETEAQCGKCLFKLFHGDKGILLRPLEGLGGQVLVAFDIRGDHRISVGSRSPTGGHQE